MLKWQTLIIIGVVILAVVSLGGVFKGDIASENDGQGKDSLGTGFYGFKGIFLTMQKLGIDIERGYIPPSYEVSDTDTVALISPSAILAGMEPEFLRNLRGWADKGGRIVLAAKRSSDLSVKPRKLGTIDKESVAVLLGVGDLQMKRFIPPEKIAGPKKGNAVSVENNPEVKKKLGKYTRQLERQEYVYNEYEHHLNITVEGTGTLQWMVQGCRKVQLPAKPFYIDRESFADGILPQGEISFIAHGQTYLLAASFAAGKGEIVVVSEPALFFNMFVSREDNAVLAARLLAGKGQHILFDEFYHGLNVKGRALWLLRRYPYNLIALLFVLSFLFMAWRGYVRLGPPLPMVARNRRSLHEYVAAMSALLGRADTRKYVLREIYEGGMWHIARGLDISRKDLQPEYLAQRMQKRDPVKAKKLLKTAGSMQILLEQDSVNLKDAVHAAKEMDRCL